MAIAFFTYVIGGIKNLIFGLMDYGMGLRSDMDGAVSLSSPQTFNSTECLESSNHSGNNDETGEFKNPSTTDQNTREKRCNQRGHEGKGQGKASGASSTAHIQASEQNPVRPRRQEEGSFGGPVRYEEKDRSGLEFEGVWRKDIPATEDSKPESEELEIAKDWWDILCKNTEKLKLSSHGTTVYDSDESDETDEDERSTTGATGVSRPCSFEKNVQHTSEGKGNGREHVKSDDAMTEEELRGQGKTKEKCDFCEKIGYTTKTCSRCKVKKYCGRECQRQDFKDHKEFCKRAERSHKAVEQLEGVTHVAMSLREGLIPENFGLFGAVSPVLAEIVGPYFHLWRPGVVIRDVYGFETFILFYTPPQTFYIQPMKVPGHLFSLPIPIPLVECLKPGNYILLLQPVLHFFADGTAGIRIDDLDREVRFVFSKQNRP